MNVTDFVALYRGRTVADAELVAVSAESSLVRKLFAELLGDSEREPNSIYSEMPAKDLQAVRDE
jgi:hypothetical protein